tara:strand:- start:22060 stop:23034 length:975 start_codon:yes stop_codon:yes gene_type:complete
MVEHIVESVHKLLLDNLPIRTNITPSGWRTFNCPMCSDTRKRAGIILGGSKISFHCFNCTYTTGWSPSPHLGKKFRELADKLGADSKTIHDVQITLMQNSELLEVAEDTEYVYNFTAFETIELPEGTQMIEALPDGNALKEYARDRGILGLYPLLHINDISNRKRVVVPFTYNGELIGWTARHINPPDKETPKYLHNMPSGYVFNIDAFANNDREIVIVTEGVFDAIMIDGVAVQGNHVTPEQAHLIDKLDKRVIVCPDKDEAGVELIDQALALGWEVSFPDWHPDCNDAADAVQKYGRLATISSIVKNATANTIKIKVKSRMF